MKTARLQAAFARKREVDNLRIERTQETNRYFDHWGKVTSRFQTWTTPEYYENAEIKLKEQKEKVKKDEMLNERREKLQKLLDIENQQYENELQAIMLRKHSPSVMLGSGRRSKYDSIDTNVLEKIKENHSDEMRRLELEAKLYKKWRNPTSGVTLSTTPLAIVGNNSNGNNNNDNNEYLRNNSLFESKSDNEIMAKLNWLDKQIENQMRREEDEKEFQQRTLKLQEEATKREEIQRERQLIRESEIKELRTMQENNVKALKQREFETIQLQEDEQHYRYILETIETELNSLKLNYETFLKIFETNLPHNVKRIKTLFRQLSDEFNERFQKDIDCLKRIKLLYSYAYDNNNIEINNINGSYTNVNSSDQIRLATIEQLIENFEQQFNTENLNQSDICNMYESEAKNNFKKWQDFWYNQEILRKTKLIELLERDKIYYDTKLNDNLKQQKLIIEVRETHLSAMENSNEKLKMLINSNNYNNDNNSNNNNNNSNSNNNNNNTKALKYDNYNQNNINGNYCNEYNNNKNNANSTSIKDIMSWNYKESSPSPPKPLTTTIEPRISTKMIRKSDGGACAAATANRNTSRSSSRVSNIYDMNSYREESTNSFQNTRSRIFGWIDDDITENKTQENLSQLNNNNNNNNSNTHSFHKKRITISNPRTTEAITTTTNNNAIIPINKTIREDLISDLRERNSRSRMINEHNNNHNNIIDSKNIKSIDVNPSRKVAIKIDVPQSNNNINENIETINKKMHSNLNINNTNNNEKSSNDTMNNSLGPKFGRKKFAWT